jgi:hypothetical protein
LPPDADTVTSSPVNRTACRVGKPAHVAELGPDRHRGQPADPVPAHECLAARLLARGARQCGVEPVEFGVDPVNHP